MTRFLEWKQPKDKAVRKALDLLSAAGFSRDNPLRFALATQPAAVTRAGELLEAQWRQLSRGTVQVKLKLLDPTVFARTRAQRDFDVAYAGVGGFTDLDGFLSTLFLSNGPFNLANWSDGRADQLINRQRAILATEERKQAIKELLLYLIDNAPSVVASGFYQLYATQPKVKGWVAETSPWPHSF